MHSEQGACVLRNNSLSTQSVLSLPPWMLTLSKPAVRTSLEDSRIPIFLLAPCPSNASPVAHRRDGIRQKTRGQRLFHVISLPRAGYEHAAATRVDLAIDRKLSLSFRFQIIVSTTETRSSTSPLLSFIFLPSRRISVFHT